MPYAIDVLQKGCNFKYRKLVLGNMKVNPTEKTLRNLSSMKPAVDKVELNQTPNQLQLPKTKTLQQLMLGFLELVRFK